MTTNKAGPGEPHEGRLPESPANTKVANVDPALQGTLGRRLREVYQEVVDEDVPDKFLTLLGELKKKESGGEQTR